MPVSLCYNYVLNKVMTQEQDICKCQKSFQCHYHKRSNMYQFNSVQSLSCVRLFATPWTEAHQSSLSVANTRSLRKLMSIESVMPSNHLILYHLLLLPSSIFPSISLFQWVNSSHQVAKVLEFQLQHQSLQWTPRTDLL